MRNLLTCCLVLFLFFQTPLVIFAQTSAKSNEVLTRVGNPPITSGGATLGTILEWDTKIVDSLQSGSFYSTLSKLVENITNGTYNTRTWLGNAYGTVYWCTYSIIDSYRLAGVEGLDKSKHAAVVNMIAFWQKAGSPYVYIEADEPNGIAKVQPGFAMFMNETPGHNEDEHVAMVKEITVDARGQGNMVSQDSNSSKKTHPYQITGGRVIGTPYKVVGFGGVEGGFGETETGTGNEAIQAIFAKLPGKASATVIFSDGSVVEKNGKVAQPAFSMIKLWVAAATMQAVQSGKISLSDSYTMKDSDKHYGGTGIIVQGKTSDTLTYEQYLTYMLVYSDNIATNVLINAIGGFQAVNSYAQQNGYAQTRVQRYIGATNYTAANDNYSSSFDGATFMKNLMEKKVVNGSASDKIISILSERTQKGADGNYLGRSLKNAQFVGKSGVGPKTRNDAGSYVDKSGKRIFESIMLTDLSNEPGGEEAINQASQAIYSSAQ